jgi:hypothetical protein
MNILFPYLNTKKWNSFCRPFSGDNEYVGPVGDDVNDWCSEGRGPDTIDFPKGVSSAPVVWNCHANLIDLEFKSGFLGAVQDPISFEISPEIGWYIVRKRESEEKPSLLFPFTREKKK